MAHRARNHWGWGWTEEALAHEQVREAAAGFAQHLGFGDAEPERPVELAAIELPAARLPSPPSTLAAICTDDRDERVRHAYGRAYRDVVRGFRGRIDHAPDVVARPRDEADVERLLAWATDVGAAVIPFGGGTSVVGGVEARVGDGYAGVITLALQALDRVLEVDDVSQAARIQAGALGPHLEEQLAPHGLTLRHFPQSFQFSTLGGWIATRAGGHFATGETHIDDLVESVRAITPAGTWESRRLPGSGAGPSPDRLLLGSEGTLGVITEAWVRVRPKPAARASRAVRFGDFAAGAAAVRAVVQAGLAPSNCRLVDAREAALTFAGDGSAALLVLGFEAADAERVVAERMEAALALCAEAGGSWEAQAEGPRGGASGAWREAFLRAPYLRDVFVAMGVLSETFETAITWERFDRFVADVKTATRAAVREVCGADGIVTCRVTHAYPDGAAPYFTVLAPARRGEEVEQWDAIKRAAADAILAGGGTITHHHAVGRDHRPWYDAQRPDPFAAALRGAKAAVDPVGLLNPGVLLDPLGQLAFGRVSAPSIAILGPGGVGGLLAAALARSGVDVTVVARESTAETIARDGIVVQSAVLGDFDARPAAIARLSEPVDVLIVATKAAALEDALARVEPDTPALVVPLLNGFDHMALLRARFPGRVVAGSIRVQADRPAPARVVQGGRFLFVELASDDPALRPALAALGAALQAAGIETRVSDDKSEARILWGKLVRLNTLACMTTAYDVPFGAIRADPERWAELEACVREGAAVARAEGAEIDPAVVFGEFELLHDGFGTSMQRDVAAGREPELDAIAGAVLRAGARHGIACPAIASLAARIAARAGVPVPAPTAGG